MLDSLIAEMDHALRVCGGGLKRAPGPGAGKNNPDLSRRDRQQSADLMRVNHAGEIAAQALYRGQAATARNDSIRTALQAAAEEECDHLSWCNHRLQQLSDRPSLLTPLWYGGAFAIGALAGLAGDRWSLGFVKETEHQVHRHLQGHLQQIPAADSASRAVVEQMRDDEARHGASAAKLGASELPTPVKTLMSLSARVMTTLAARF